MRVYSFPQGGIVFDDPSAPDSAKSLMSFLPDIAIVSLAQHSGGQAEPVVEQGQHVLEGQLVAVGQGAGQANIHAPVPGKVIKQIEWETAGRGKTGALVIRMEGAFELLGKPETAYDWQELSPYELRKTIAEHGVVEMEGIGRPIADILSTFHAVQGEITLVVRCVSDDPWLAADFCLCQERPGAVSQGAVIAAKAAQATRIVVAATPDKKALAASLAKATGEAGVPSLKVFVCGRYPQRNERELEIVLRSYEAKESLRLGALVFLGPATLAAIHDAVRLRRPILDRYVAVGGTAVRRPQVLRARIGSRIGDLFAECGGFSAEPRAVVAGSPLLGRPVVSLDEPLVKTTYALFANRAEKAGPGSREPCINCGDCRSVCPTGLDPEALYKGIIDGSRSSATLAQAMDCHGCGCCEVVCPSRLPLGTTIINAGF